MLFRHARCRIPLIVGLLCFCCILSASGAEVDECRKLLIKGEYEKCITLAEEGVNSKESGEEWSLLLVQSLLTVGRYEDAQTNLKAAIKRNRNSIRLLLLGHEVLRQASQVEEAKSMLEEINNLGGTRMWAYRDAANLVALGKAAILLGADPKRVLDNFFDRAKKAEPDKRDAYLASGELALGKNDFELASKVFQAGLKKFPDDADFHYGLARAYAPSERLLMIKALDAALEHNEHHAPTYLLLCDHMIDAERYEAAEKTLEKALAINPWHPEAWAYRAVLAHLRSDADGQAKAHESALKFLTTNPRVDHLIGKKLSQKYRFAEGAASQRLALKLDPNFLFAKIQLAQDLLRLGDETEGWKLADEVHAQDAYDVVAYNLVTLHDSMGKFTSITNEDFAVRMGAQEAPIYGDAVLGLLQRAKTNLVQKYGMEIARPTRVEIFPEQKDFGVRTFAMPENPGFLGVCFGSVITANSPASQTGNPANWQAVLWHEFCHVVTLQMTRNKMPRWLSEGISVYEEMQVNPIWGQKMNPRYREMVLGDDFTPISELSSAFLTPKTDHHLQFAYYESSLAVEFLVKQYGLEALKKILRDLAAGKPINPAIEANTAPLEKIEKEFAEFAKKRAQDLAPGLDWDKPTPDEVKNPPPDWFTKRSNNYYVLTQQAKKLLTEKKWQEAKAPLEKLIKAYPDHSDGDNAYALLAAAHRGLKETEQEHEVLKKLAALDADNIDAYLRLMELGLAAKNWQEVFENAERYLAVNPLVPQPHRFLALASEELDQRKIAIQEYKTLLRLDPPDPADTHFRLARLLHKEGDVAAKRHVVQALEEAPRFRDAHRLLLEINGQKEAASKPKEGANN